MTSNLTMVPDPKKGRRHQKELRVYTAGDPDLGSLVCGLDVSAYIS